MSDKLNTMYHSRIARIHNSIIRVIRDRDTTGWQNRINRLHERERRLWRQQDKLNGVIIQHNTPIAVRHRY